MMDKICHIAGMIVLALFMLGGIVEMVYAVTNHPIANNLWWFYHAWAGLCCMLWIVNSSNEDKIRRLEKRIERLLDKSRG
jgi:hypothetical protein